DKKFVYRVILLTGFALGLYVGAVITVVIYEAL
ncbi:hypothetical protein LCGC14_1685010, partial [marine sediment metagenome]